MNIYRITLIFVLVLLSSVVSCGAATPSLPASSALLSGPDPSKLGTVERDVTYCSIDGVDLKLDIYYPKIASGPLPVTVYVHGGAWMSGDKTEGAGANEIPELVKRGFLVVSVNYRLAPQYKFPAQINDVKCAVRFLRTNAREFGLNPEKIGVWGGSAGGHLAALLGLTDNSAGFEGTGGYEDQSSRVQAVVDMFGPADLKVLFNGPRGIMMEQVFGTADIGSQTIKQASPVSYITPDDPPFLILQGDKDNVVPPEQSQILYDRLVAGDIPAKLVMVKNGGHGFRETGGAISPTRAEITDIVADFFEEHLK